MRCGDCGSKHIEFEIPADLVWQPTLKDFFAAASLAGFMADSECSITHKKASEISYEAADAMMEARKQAPRRPLSESKDLGDPEPSEPEIGQETAE